MLTGFTGLTFRFIIASDLRAQRNGVLSNGQALEFPLLKRFKVSNDLFIPGKEATASFFKSISQKTFDLIQGFTNLIQGCRYQN